MENPNSGVLFSVILFYFIFAATKRQGPYLFWPTLNDLPFCSTLYNMLFWTLLYNLSFAITTKMTCFSPQSKPPAKDRTAATEYFNFFFLKKKSPETAKELNNTINWLIQQKEPKSHFSSVYLFRCSPVALDITPQGENTQSIINLHRSHGCTWKSHGWRVRLYDDVKIHTVDTNDHMTQCFSVFFWIGCKDSIGSNTKLWYSKKQEEKKKVYRREKNQRRERRIRVLFLLTYYL